MCVSTGFDCVGLSQNPDHQVVGRIADGVRIFLGGTEDVHSISTVVFSFVKLSVGSGNQFIAGRKLNAIAFCSAKASGDIDRAGLRLER